MWVVTTRSITPLYRQPHITLTDRQTKWITKIKPFYLSPILSDIRSRMNCYKLLLYRSFVCLFRLNSLWNMCLTVWPSVTVMFQHSVISFLLLSHHHRFGHFLKQSQSGLACRCKRHLIFTLCASESKLMFACLLACLCCAKFQHKVFPIESSMRTWFEFNLCTGDIYSITIAIKLVHNFYSLSFPLNRYHVFLFSLLLNLFSSSLN